MRHRGLEVWELAPPDTWREQWLGHVSLTLVRQIALRLIETRNQSSEMHGVWPFYSSGKGPSTCLTERSLSKVARDLGLHGDESLLEVFLELGSGVVGDVMLLGLRLQFLLVQYLLDGG